jgi:hypothetical protein
MIGILKAYCGIYLKLIATGTLIFFGLPMLLWPLKWAKVLGWRIPEHTDLAVYFGRCLGSVITVIGFLAFQAAEDPQIQPFYFNLIMANFVMMIFVHLYGAIKKIQPLSETLEIGYWLLLAIITLFFYPK